LLPWFAAGPTDVVLAPTSDAGSAVPLCWRCSSSRFAEADPSALWQPAGAVVLLSLNLIRGERD
jgi:hypothetical protein